MPDMTYYGICSMKTKDRESFIRWYNNEKNEIFNNKQELIKYCKQDVTILRLACLKFKSLLLDLTSVNPFDQVTIAGTCMAIFKAKFVEPYQIAIIPSNGYRLRDKQSFKALKWLAWLEHSQNIKILSSVRGREMRISNDIIVDGFYNNTIYEFLGCYWHQCQICFPFQHHKPIDRKKSSLRAIYESTIARSKKIMSFGFNLVQIWEHEFDEMLKSNFEMSQYLGTVDYLQFEPLNPRDAFFGGRTGVCKLYHEVQNDEKILYYDVTSLYPFINKYSDIQSVFLKSLLVMNSRIDMFLI